MPLEAPVTTAKGLVAELSTIFYFFYFQTMFVYIGKLAPALVLLRATSGIIKLITIGTAW